MKNVIVGALFNDFVPKMIVGTHILREFRSYLMKNVYLCGVIACCALFKDAWLVVHYIM